MKCPKCNFEVSENTKFCPECGEKIQAENTEPESSQNKVETSPIVSPQQETDNKTTKNKLKKAIIIPTISVLACGLIFLILFLTNPFCMFGHEHRSYIITKEATCTQAAVAEHVCDKCGDSKPIPIYGSPRAHDFGNITCNAENTCLLCGEKKFFTHDAAYTKHCTHCGQYEYAVKVPVTPFLVNDYGYDDRIRETIMINSIKAEEDYYGVKITYNITRIFHENGANYSTTARFGWKLYDSNGTVVNSGTGKSSGSIKAGEASNGGFTLYGSNLEKWTNYRLEILDTK